MKGTTSVQERHHPADRTAERERALAVPSQASQFMRLGKARLRSVAAISSGRTEQGLTGAARPPDPHAVAVGLGQPELDAALEGAGEELLRPEVALSPSGAGHLLQVELEAVGVGVEGVGQQQYVALPGGSDIVVLDICF